MTTLEKRKSEEIPFAEAGVMYELDTADVFEKVMGYKSPVIEGKDLLEIALEENKARAESKREKQELLARQERALDKSAKKRTTERDFLDTTELTEQDKEQITREGYTLLREVGEGQGSSRRAYDARRKIGNLELEGILKVPKMEEDITSINALINLQKRNINLREAMISGKLKHPGIARILHSFQLEDGRTCNYEDKTEGWSLSTFIKRAGPIRDIARLKQIFLPVISALEYAHSGVFETARPAYEYHKGILHRDVTANNILIPQSTEAGGVLTDWQNAAFERDIENLAIPTRGGTSYTHPILLNSLVSGDLARATKRMDVYSLGATLYEALTAEKAFSYKVVENPSGKEITVGKRKFNLKLEDGEEEISEITPERHEVNRKKAIKIMKEKKVPRKLISLVSDMLTLDENKGLYDMKKVEERFIEATDTTVQEVKKNIGRYIRTSFITAGACLGIGLAALGGSCIRSLPQSPTAPTLSDILRSQSQTRAFAMGNYEMGTALRQNGSCQDEFQKYISEAAKRREEITGKEFSSHLEFIDRSSPIDKRLVSSILRSIVLEKERSKISGSERLPYGLVPIDYLKTLMGKESYEREEKDRIDEFRELFFMSKYTTGMFSFGDSVEDVYTKALCSKEEIELAKARTQHQYLIKGLRDKGFKGMDGNIVPIGEIASSRNVTNIEYFARRGKENKRFLGQDTETVSFIPGYSSELNPIKKRIIDRAVALYTITDDKGKLDLTKYSQNQDLRNIPAKGEAAK